MVQTLSGEKEADPWFGFEERILCSLLASKVPQFEEPVWVGRWRVIIAYIGYLVLCCGLSCIVLRVPSTQLTPFQLVFVMLIVLGSAHHERLNILTGLLGHSHTVPFHKIKGSYEIPTDLEISGDTISHLGGLLDSTRYLTCTNIAVPPHLSYEGSKPMWALLLQNPRI